MASEKEFPGFVPAFSALGAERLDAIARAAKVDATDAATLLARIKTPADVMRFVDDADVDAMGAALGIGLRAEWRASISDEAIAALPAYRRPSYAGDVFGRVQHRVIPPRAALRAEASASPRVAAVRDWPDLANRAAWDRVKPDVVTQALAKATGFAPADPTADGLARLVDEASGHTYVAVIGGAYAMGISAAEKKALRKRAKPLGIDAVEHAKAIAKQASPQHEVTVAPFLVTEQLVSKLLDAEAAAALVGQAKRRLPSEAEWEWIARGGDSEWLSADAIRLGVQDLAWGEWVDDGWHDTYKNAPGNGAPWEPRDRPETARAGAGMLAPWQNPGEELLLHVTARDRASGRRGVRFALDLPRRS